MEPLSFQPIPYQGSKRLLAPRICSYFPKRIDTLFEPFAGSAAVTMYAAKYGLARHFVIGDIFPELVQLWKFIIEKPEYVIRGYTTVWKEQFLVGDEHFYKIRDSYNSNKNPIYLLYLIARCVKNAVRFGSNGKFTQSVDKRRKGVRPERMSNAILSASFLLKGKCDVYCGDFLSCFEYIKENDVLYLDPPYQGTSSGRDKRYAQQISRSTIIDALQNLNSEGIRFLLSYDGKTGEKTYAPPLPVSLGLRRIYIDAGRSSQSTLAGRAEFTVESLYISQPLIQSIGLVSNTPTRQANLFSAVLMNS